MRTNCTVAYSVSSYACALTFICTYNMKSAYLSEAMYSKLGKKHIGHEKCENPYKNNGFREGSTRSSSWSHHSYWESFRNVGKTLLSAIGGSAQTDSGAQAHAGNRRIPVRGLQKTVEKHAFRSRAVLPYQGAAWFSRTLVLVRARLLGNLCKPLRK